jgi:phage shock protein PspC (stress-responsive transcriptional regulator)
MRGRDSTAMWLRPPRPEHGRLLGGVCAGLAERYEIDPSLVRLAFLLLVFAKGLGVLAYLGLWLVMPAEGSRAASLTATARDNLLTIRRDLAGAGDGMREAWARAGQAEWPRPLGRRWTALLLIAAGAGILLWSFGAFAWLTGPRILGLVAVVLGAGALLSLAQEGGRRRW